MRQHRRSRAANPSALSMRSQPPAEQYEKRGGFELGHLRHPDLAGVHERLAGERAAVLGRPPAAAERGRRDAAGDDLAGLLERDERRPHRDAADEVGRAVDRIDDPAALVRSGGPLDLALLLAEHDVAGPGGLELRAGWFPRPPRRTRSRTSCPAWSTPPGRWRRIGPWRGCRRCRPGRAPAARRRSRSAPCGLGYGEVDRDHGHDLAEAPVFDTVQRHCRCTCWWSTPP